MIIQVLKMANELELIGHQEGEQHQHTTTTTTNDDFSLIKHNKRIMKISRRKQIRPNRLMNDETLPNTENPELVISQHQTADHSSDESNTGDISGTEEKLNAGDIGHERIADQSLVTNFVSISSSEHHDNNISTPLTNSMQATNFSPLSFSSPHSPHHYCSSSSSSSTCSSSPTINTIKPVSYTLLNSNQNNLTCNDIILPILTTTETSTTDNVNENSSLLLTSSTSPSSSTLPRHEAYCHLCRKEFCNKYFLKTHFAKKHGVLDMTTTVSVGPGVMSHFKYSADKSNINKNLVATTSSSSSSSKSPTHGNGILATPSDSIDDMLHVKKCEENTNNTMKISKETKTTPLSTPTKHDHSADALTEDYCELCQKRFCNKYYLRKHRAEVHGVYTDYIKSLQRSGESPLKSGRPSTTQNTNTLSILTPTTPSTSSQNATSSNMLLMNPYMLHPSQFFLPRNTFSDLKIPQKTFTSPSNFTIHSKISSSSEQQQHSTKDDNNINTIKIENECDEAEKHDGQTLCEDMNELDIKLNEQHKSNENEEESIKQKEIKVESIENKLNDRRNLLCCELCDQQFKNKQLLRIHVNKHHSTTSLENGRNHTKQMCPSNKNNLDRLAFLSPYVDTTSVLAHKLEHTMPYGIMADSYFCAKMADRVVCEICNKQVCNKYFLKTHKAKVHGITNDIAPTMVNMNSSQQQSTTAAVVDDTTATFNDDNESSQSTKEDETSSTGVNNESFSMSSLILTAEDRGDLIEANIDPEAYCIICKKEFCSKYFLRTHQQNIHGLPIALSSSSTTITMTTAPSLISNSYTNGLKRNQKHTKRSAISPSIPTSETLSDSKIAISSSPSLADTYQTLLQFMQAAAAITENPSQNPFLIMSALSGTNQFSDLLSNDYKKRLLIQKNGTINENESNDEEEDEADGNHACKKNYSDSDQQNHQKTGKRKVNNSHEQENSMDIKKRKTNSNDFKLSKLNVDTSQINLTNETLIMNGGDSGGLQPFLLESDDPKFIHTFVPCMVFLPVKNRVTKQVHLNLRLKPVLTNDETN